VGCLEADTIVALVDGNLSVDELSTAQQHLATCQSCSDLVAASAGNTDDRAPIVALGKGASFGRYVILDRVGRGGMGEVYAAFDELLDRKIALKLLRHGERGDAALATARERLLREAKAIARLSHPNVVVLHDAGQVDGRVFIAMEFLEGSTLAKWLRTAPRSWREIRDAFCAAGQGLAAAHDAGLVHRDFKPQNVHVGRDGVVRVMDFGLASDVDADARGEPVIPASDEVPSTTTVALTRTGAMVGTPLYMAPEQLLGQVTDARSDQFSFCVALYHALYGERPFASDSLKTLIDSVGTGKVREPPKKARVPSFFRKVLLRGLAREPAQRFPSMAALLEALRTDPTRRRRQLAIGGAVVLLAAAAVAGTLRMTTANQRLCRAADDRLVGAWELAPDGARREQVHKAFLASGSGFAEETWRRVSGILDDYGRRWAAAYTDACEGTHVRGDQSNEVLDLRMACLDASRGALRALTGVLSTPDREAVLQAISAAAALPLLDRCSNVTVLRAAVAPPSDAGMRKRVEDIRAGLAEVKALGDTGKFSEAEQKATPLAAAARATEYRPVLAEALGALGWVQAMRHDGAHAAVTLEDAVLAAIAAHQDDAALLSTAMLLSALGDLGRYQESDRWYRVGQALVDRLGPGHERAAGWLLLSQSRIHHHRGEYKAALEAAHAALALELRVLPPDHPDLALAWNSVAETLRSTGDLRAAAEAGAKALALGRRAFGDDHPLLGESHVNYGEILFELGRHKEAEALLRKAVDFMTARFGQDHAWVAYALVPLGKTLIATKRAAESVPVLERAVRIRDRREPNQPLVAEARFGLARAIWEAGGDRGRARQLATAARDFYVRDPGLMKQAKEVEVWLNDVR
jgi:tetratricopeptide (TPR) repeat protein